MKDNKSEFEIDGEVENSRVLKILLIGIAIIMLLIIAFLISMKKTNENSSAIIIDGKITRTYDELFAELEEEPEDICQVKYYSNIPKIIQDDIDTILNSKEDISIVYQKEDRFSDITISKSQDGKNIEVSVFSHNSGLDDYSRMVGDFSFYRSGNSIVIYGRDSLSNRLIQKSSLSLDEDGYDSINHLYIKTYFDLWGTETLINSDEDDLWDSGFDTIRSYNSDMTLARVGKEFNFYVQGDKIGEPVIFPGGDIVEFNYYYILDDKNDLYYFYYSTNPDDYWMHFEKVAEDIDYVTDDKMGLEIPEEKYRPIEFVVYVKNGKRYTAISDYHTEMSYGQNYGKLRKSADLLYENDFSITTIAVDDEKISKVVLTKSDYISLSSGTYFDWYLKYEYISGDICVFSKTRMNGLDRELSVEIPEEKINDFDGMELTVEEIQSVKDELKAVYAKYE